MCAHAPIPHKKVLRCPQIAQGLYSLALMALIVSCSLEGDLLL